MDQIAVAQIIGNEEGFLVPPEKHTQEHRVYHEDYHVSSPGHLLNRWWHLESNNLREIDPDLISPSSGEQTVCDVHHGTHGHSHIGPSESPRWTGHTPGKLTWRLWTPNRSVATDRLLTVWLLHIAYYTTGCSEVEVVQVWASVTVFHYPALNTDYSEQGSVLDRVWARNHFSHRGWSRSVGYKEY
jgi:hypothetical protein